MSPEQTLAVGESVSEKFRKLARPVTQEVTSPRYAYGMIAGKPSCGKTSLLLSCEGGFVINCDRTLVPQSDIQGAIWPTMNEKGQTINVDGSSFVMKWEDIEGVLNTLCELATSDQPRPDFVAFDTLAGMLNMGMEYITRKAGATAWRDMDGRRAYDQLYTLILDSANRLRKHGYGVFLTCHLINKFIPIGENMNKEMASLTITDGFWSRIYWQLDMCLVMLNEWSTETVMIEQKAGDRIRKVPKQVDKQAYLLTSSRPEYSGITKTRVEFPETSVPRVGAWQTFEDAYTGTTKE